MNAKKRILQVLGKEHRPQAICVLGSGRCGTSMVTRAIHFLGVDLGSDLIESNETNPTGFWENKQVVELQKQINARMNWKRPFPAGWQHDKDMQPFKKALKQTLKEQFADRQLWAWKDPRNCECIAMWQEILKELRLDAGYLIMVRNPVDVAASFQKAYNRKEKATMRLWKVRTLISLRETNQEKRILIDYDDFLGNALERLREIAEMFALPWPEDEAQVKAQLDTFVDPDLQHRRSGIEELANHPDADEEVRQLYGLCLQATHSRRDLQSKGFQADVEGLYQSFMDRRVKV